MLSPSVGWLASYVRAVVGAITCPLNNDLYRVIATSKLLQAGISCLPDTGRREEIETKDIVITSIIQRNVGRRYGWVRRAEPLSWSNKGSFLET